MSRSLINHIYFARFCCLLPPFPPFSATPGPPPSSLLKAGAFWWGSNTKYTIPNTKYTTPKCSGELLSLWYSPSPSQTLFQKWFRETWSPVCLPTRYLYSLHQVHSEWGEKELRVSSESSVDEVIRKGLLLKSWFFIWLSQEFKLLSHFSASISCSWNCIFLY